MSDITLQYSTTAHPGYRKALWQIFVPVSNNDGTDYSIKIHKEWDAKVKGIAGGLTINKRSRGIWQSPMTGKVFEERMIPVTIFCSKEEIENIIMMTVDHYDQEAVMCYLVSEFVITAERNSNGNS